jgi:hypothetical protein
MERNESTGGWGSEQVESSVIAGAPRSHSDRTRVLMAILRRATQDMQLPDGLLSEPGRPWKANLVVLLQYILDHAREVNLDAKFYDKIWDLRDFFGRLESEHVIIDNGTNPAIAGESA